jgi:hypothetical protein
MRSFSARTLVSAPARGVALLLVATAIPAFSQPEVGLVGGVARESSTGNPVAEAQIVAHNLDNGMAQSTVSRTDGIFTLTHLEPGRYEVLATKHGYLKSSARVEVGTLCRPLRLTSRALPRK